VVSVNKRQKGEEKEVAERESWAEKTEKKKKEERRRRRGGEW
jgi:hypothetical protein